MKRAIILLTAIWVLNPFMLILYLQNRPLYDAFVESGAQVYSCIDWDANGHRIDGVCTTPMPQF